MKIKTASDEVKNDLDTCEAGVSSLDPSASASQVSLYSDCPNLDTQLQELMEDKEALKERLGRDLTAIETLLKLFNRKERLS